MTDKRKEDMMARMYATQRGLSKEEIAERQRKAAPGMGAMTPEEIAERQRVGSQNIYSKMPGEV